MYDRQKSVEQSYLKKAKEYCDSRNQKGYQHWIDLSKYRK